MATARHWEQDKEATVYVGNLDERVTDRLVWELMLQAGRIVNVHLPKDRVTQNHQGYGFVEFMSEEDAEYAAKIMNQIRLYGKPIRVNKASADKQKTVEVGAELFVGNLDALVDERMLYDTFSRFGTLISAPKVARDDTSNLSKGYGFVSFATFEASDEAIANMNGQYLMNKEVTVQYAYKKDGKGERHGDEAERMLAQQARKNNLAPQTPSLPPQLFAAPQSTAPSTMVSTAGSGANGGPVPPPMAAAPNFPSNAGQQPPAQPAQAHSMPPRPSQPLPPPPAGLPSRPPPSQAGYGGPPNMMPGGFGTPNAPPAGFAGPQNTNGGPPGFQGPPGFAPPQGSPVNGFPGAPPPPPPGMPQGYPGQQYGRRGDGYDQANWNYFCAYYGHPHQTQ